MAYALNSGTRDNTSILVLQFIWITAIFIKFIKTSTQFNIR